MRVHHLNCATLCPWPARLVNGHGGFFRRARMVAHCLLLETTDGLTLVDTGLGLADIEDASARLGRAFGLHVLGVLLDVRASTHSAADDIEHREDTRFRFIDDLVAKFAEVAPA